MLAHKFFYTHKNELPSYNGALKDVKFCFLMLFFVLTNTRANTFSQ